MKKNSHFSLNHVKIKSYDHYISLLFSPTYYREEFAIASAFFLEIEQCFFSISDSYILQLRLQWWIDNLKCAKSSVRIGAPVVDALFSLKNHEEYLPFFLKILEICQNLASYNSINSLGDLQAFHENLLEGYWDLVFSFAKKTYNADKISYIDGQKASFIENANALAFSDFLIRILHYCYKLRYRLFIPDDVRKSLALGEEDFKLGAPQNLQEIFISEAGKHYKMFYKEGTKIPTFLLPFLLPYSCLAEKIKRRQNFLLGDTNKVKDISLLKRQWLIAKTAATGKFMKLKI